MTISLEELKQGIASLSDRELLSRWQSQLFTEEAVPVAEAEIQRRSLDLSPEHAADLQAEYQASTTLHRKKAWAGIGKGCLIVVLTIIGSIAATVTALLLR